MSYCTFVRGTRILFGTVVYVQAFRSTSCLRIRQCRALAQDIFLVVRIRQGKRLPDNFLQRTKAEDGLKLSSSQIHCNAQSDRGSRRLLYVS